MVPTGTITNSKRHALVGIHEYGLSTDEDPPRFRAFSLCDSPGGEGGSSETPLLRNGKPRWLSNALERRFLGGGKRDGFFSRERARSTGCQHQEESSVGKDSAISSVAGEVGVRPLRSFMGRDEGIRDAS